VTIQRLSGLNSTVVLPVEGNSLPLAAGRARCWHFLVASFLRDPVAIRTDGDVVRPAV
jgi:hypothetical protein